MKDILRTIETMSQHHQDLLLLQTDTQMPQLGLPQLKNMIITSVLHQQILQRPI